MSRKNDDLDPPHRRDTGPLVRKPQENLPDSHEVESAPRVSEDLDQPRRRDTGPLARKPEEDLA